jgi:hypothetical protein
MAENNMAEIPSKGTLPITVNKSVVKHLSIGLYRNYALAIKELISNSYDAGATEVKIKLDLKNKKIVVRDNGRGMDYTEFKDQYLDVGHLKPPSKTLDELGRMRIGTFGIGFLAPLPYCKKMIVITKKRGNNKVLQASINAENFFNKGSWDIKDEEVPYEIMESDLGKDIGETIVVLEDIKPQIAEDLQRKKKSKAKIDQLSGFDKFKWTLCQYCPIQFPPDRKDLRDFFESSNQIPMKLWLDGKELFRNVPLGSKILEKAKETFGDIHVKYAIMTSYSPIRPEEARGLQVRLRDVAIGFPRDFDVTKLGRVLGRLNFICGEVHIIKGLDNALMVTRDSFNYTQEVADLYEFFRGKLTEWNDRLYDEAEDDKRIYESLPDIEADAIAEELIKADVVRFPKERFRLSKSSVTSKKLNDVSLPVEKLKKALSKRKDFQVFSNKGKRNKNELPIEIDAKNKSITIYEEHPSFLETIEIENQKFPTSYEKWDYRKSPYSICKLDKKEGRAIFNSDHPLFKSKINERIIKELSLGILLIIEDNKDKEKMLIKFNRLLEDVFQG